MPTGPRRRLPVPASWLEPSGPREPALRSRWEARTEAERAALLRRAVTPEEALGPDEELVHALALDRGRSAGRASAAAAFVGWLVLMTIWGIGRSGFADHEATFLIVGLVSGFLVTVLGVRRARRRGRQARAVLGVLQGRPRGSGRADRPRGDPTHVDG